MKAVAFVAPGGPEVLHIVDLPEPDTGPNDVRVRIHAATVNPVDAAIRSGRQAAALQSMTPPYVLGREFAGEIVEIGRDVVPAFEVGDRVMALVMSNHAYAEQIVVPAELIVRVPAGASDIEAATLPLNGLTARLALDLLDLKANEVVAVTGAAGGVGGYAVQLAKADSLRVIADAAPDDEELVSSLGADIVLPRGDELSARIRDVIPEGVDGLVDTALMNALIVPAIREGGRMASLGSFQDDEEKGITFHGVMVRTVTNPREKLEQLRKQVEQGQVTLRVARVFAPEEAAEAHRMLESKGSRGRIVLEF